MRKFNTRLFAGLLAVFCCMTALSATAYADGGYYEQSEDGSETPPSSIDSITISTESVRLPEQQGSEAQAGKLAQFILAFIHDPLQLHSGCLAVATVVHGLGCGQCAQGGIGRAAEFFQQFAAGCLDTLAVLILHGNAQDVINL